MRRLISAGAVLACLLLLSACGRTKSVYETVEDQVIPVMATETAYVVAVTLPEDVTEQAFSDANGVHEYRQADGDYVITVQILDTADAEQALRDLTGLDRDALTVLRLERDGMTEYHTGWYAETDGTMNRACVVCSGQRCYCVCFSAPEDRYEQLRPCMSEIMQSVRLIPS